MAMDAPVKKRRSRKKKPAVVDPEAERQERELRMKIKQSLHTQQVLRTEVEEDEAQRTVANIASANMRRGVVSGRGQASNQMNSMMMGGMGMGGFGNMQPQMEETRMQQQQQYRFTTQNQQYGYHENQEGSGRQTIPNMQQQMQQMKQQLEMQKQQLEHQLKMKHQMEIQQIQLQQRQQLQSPFSTEPQGQQLQSPLSPRPQRHDDFGAKLSSEEIMRSLKHEQERLLKEAHKRGRMNNTGNINTQGGVILPSPQYDVSSQYQQNSNYRVGQSNQQQQHRDGITHGNCSNQQDQHRNSPQLLAQSDQQQHEPQCYQQSGGMAHGNFSNQQTCIFQNQEQQLQSYPSQKGASQDQQNNGESSQHIPHIDKRSMSPQLQGLQSSPDPHEKSVFSSSSNTDSWLKAGSINSAELFNNSNSSMAFHSVGNMSASFSSTLGASGMEALLAGTSQSEHKVQDKDAPNDIAKVGGSHNPGYDSEGNGTVSKKSIHEGSAGCGAQDTAEKNGKTHDHESGSASINKGSAYTETNVPLQSIALQPIQENEADETSNNGDKMRFEQSSLMMSFVEGEFMQSNLSMNGANSMNLNELMMSMDSATLNALMKHSQSGDISLGGFPDPVDGNTAEAMVQQPTVSSSETNQAPSPGNTIGKQDANQVKIGDSANFSSLVSSVSMEDNQQKETNVNRLSKNSKEGSARSSRGSRGSRGSRSAAPPRSSLAMMTEISQWTLNNPFDNSSSGDNAGTPSDTPVAPPAAKASVSKKHRQGDSNVESDCRVDIGDFHSLGGSIDTMNLSMMSSMTREDNLSESIRALDISNSSVDQRKGKWV
eukprot:CAMPEP_0172546384 /NCGR_PEP_ID=MMETSP1067-20121228/16160_1 /TAXON_ID=265564 ORGANISM="Thalassiosira punctigera, Strain Tpunct2005C2" /NCGR_SAMPLE_ID=MMETSP1067 /ASSEMBLY_ACC=CAM_ASM_000444 /LENGTH=822 /DNA_ID=CAMNT_0013333309 /DNA_START=109 /DNA_END=2577 /DNA_ORIENTATION=+